MDLAKGLALLAAALLPFCSFAESFDGKLSEAVRIQYETDLPYCGILKDFDADSFNKRLRFQIEYSSVSGNELEPPYSKFISKTTNRNVVFKGCQPALPLFVSEVKKTLLKKLKALAPGSKVFVYATFDYTRTPAKNGKSGMISYLILDDVLTLAEETAMDDYREQFGKPRALKPVPPPCETKPAAPAKPATPAAPAAPAAAK